MKRPIIQIYLIVLLAGCATPHANDNDQITDPIITMLMFSENMTMERKIEVAIQRGYIDSQFATKMKLLKSQLDKKQFHYFYRCQGEYIEFTEEGVDVVEDVKALYRKIEGKEGKPVFAIYIPVQDKDKLIQKYMNDRSFPLEVRKEAHDEFHAGKAPPEKLENLWLSILYYEKHEKELKAKYGRRTLYIVNNEVFLTYEAANKKYPEHLFYQVSHGR